MNTPTLKLRDRAQDVHLQLPSGRRRIDAFGEADEGDAESLELLEQDQNYDVAVR